MLNWYKNNFIVWMNSFTFIIVLIFAIQIFGKVEANDVVSPETMKELEE